MDNEEITKPVKKIKPYSTEWEREANNLARTFMSIYPCHECGHPVIDGYCCATCGSRNPGGQ